MSLISFSISSLMNILLMYLFLQVRLVRVTKRVHEAYFAQLYLSKVCVWCLSIQLFTTQCLHILRLFCVMILAGG